MLLSSLPFAPTHHAAFSSASSVSAARSSCVIVTHCLRVDTRTAPATARQRRAVRLAACYSCTMNATVHLVLSGVGAFATLIAAINWLSASRIEVPDNIDTFIPALQRAPRLNARAAFAARIAAACG